MDSKDYSTHNSMEIMRMSQSTGVEVPQQIQSIKSNEIQVALAPTATNTNQSAEVTEFECRICLEKESDGKHLVNVCLCKGSLKYIHNDCLNQWIQQQISNKEKLNIILKDGLVCEICKSSTKVCVTSQARRRTLKQIEEVMEKNKLIRNIIYLIMFMALVAEAIGIVVIMSGSPVSDGMKIFMYLTMVFCGITLAIMLCYFVKKFLYIRVTRYAPTNDLH